MPEFMGYGLKTILFAWLGFIALTGLSAGLLTHYVQDLMNTQSCVNFNYQLVDPKDGKND